VSERGAERSRRYRLLADMASDSRGQRFARRMSGTAGPRFADIANIPEWLSAEPAAQDRIALLAALLRHRRAIDAELSGPRLAMLAEAVGEDLLDLACDSDVPGDIDDAPLPPPERLLAEGRALLEAGLPRPLSGRYPGARDDPAARAIAGRATAIAG
jgi:hypothetical protein